MAASGALSLFLDTASNDEIDEKRAGVRRKLLLRRLQKILATVILEDPHTKKEAKTWLVASIAKLNPPDSTKLKAFLGFLPNRTQRKKSHSTIANPREATLLRQLALLLSENRSTAPRLARLFSRDVDLVKRFFGDDEKRVEAWFGHFAASAGGEHLFGAKALSRYAILHRDECWEELEWAGSHPQAPAMVAAKPHYLAELDMVRTVRNFLRHVPGFWTADEWRDALSCGEFLALDADFFAERTVAILNAGGRKGSPDGNGRETEYVSKKVLELVEDVIQKEPFQTVCNRLLHLASPDGLLSFLDQLQHLEPDTKARDPRLAAVADVSWRSLDDALLSNACAANGRQIVRLLKEDEFADQLRGLDELVADASTSDEEAEFRSFRSGLRERSKATERKWLILESWLLRWRLSKADPQSMQDNLKRNEIAFRFSADADHELFQEDTVEAGTERKDRKRKRKLKARRRKRRSRSSPADSGSYAAGSEDGSDSASTAETERTGRKRNRGRNEGRRKRKSGSSAAGSEEGSGSESDAEAAHRKQKRRRSPAERNAGTYGTGPERTLADADGVYLQTDGFGIRWSLVLREGNHTDGIPLGFRLAVGASGPSSGTQPGVLA